MDYTEKRSLPVSIPDYHYVERNGERFVVKFFRCLLANRRVIVFFS